MRLQHPFEAITTSVDGDCLAVLARADHEFTVSRLLPMLGRKRSLTGVRNALDRLVDQGVVSVRQVGNVNSYSLNRSHMLAPALVDIATARDRLVSRMSAEMAEWQVEPRFSALFGSAARGDMHTDSDIDVLVVHADDVNIELWSEQIAHFQRQVTSWTGNDTRVLSLAEREVLDHGTEDAVIREVTRDGIVLAGPTSWLRRRARGLG